MHVHGGTTSHSFCVNFTHFELISHSSEFTNLDRSDLVTEFRFQFIDDRPSIEKVQVLLENIQYMDTGTFDSDRCLMKELMGHQGFYGNPLGIVLTSSKKTCTSCTGKLRVRAASQASQSYSVMNSKWHTLPEALLQPCKGLHIYPTLHIPYEWQL